MRALLRKELRELLPAWILLPFFLLPALWQVSRGEVSLHASIPDALGVLARAVLFGGAIGYAQLRREIWRGTLPSLLHRDTGLLGALAAKAVAGLGVGYALAALPVLLGTALAGIMEPLFLEFILEPGHVWRLCLLAGAVVPAYGIGALGATWRGRLSTRLIFTGGGLMALLALFDAGEPTVYTLPIDNDPLRFCVAGGVLLGSALFALAGWRLERFGDSDRHGGALETALRVAAVLVLLVLPAWYVCSTVRQGFLVLSLVSTSTSSAMRAATASTDSRWMRLEGSPWTGNDPGRVLVLDRGAGVLHAFDLDRVQGWWVKPLRPAGSGHFLLQPGGARFGANVEPLPNGDLLDPATGLTWQVLGPQAPRLEGRTSKDGAPRAGAVTRDPRAFVSYRNVDQLEPVVEVFDPATGVVLWAYHYALKNPVALILLCTFDCMQGPLAATVSFASDAAPGDVMARPFAEPLLVGGRRPWLLAGQFLLFALLSALAVRHVLLTGGSRTRAACWVVGLFLVGPLLYAAFQLIEPRRAYWRGSSRRASLPQLSARVVSPAAP